jgi:hypothetical protein
VTKNESNILGYIGVGAAAGFKAGQKGVKLATGRTLKVSILNQDVFLGLGPFTMIAYSDFSNGGKVSGDGLASERINDDQKA